MAGMFTQAALEKRLRQLEEDLRIAQEDSKAPREIITSLSKSLEALTKKEDNDVEMRVKLDLLLTKMDKQSEDISVIKKELSNNSQQIEILKNQQNNIVKSVQGLEHTFKDKTEDLINTIDSKADAANINEELLKITTKVGNCETLTTQLTKFMNDFAVQLSANEWKTRKLVVSIKEKVCSIEANAPDSESEKLDQISSNISKITKDIEKIKRDTVAPLKILTDKIPSIKKMTDSVKELKDFYDEALAKAVEDLTYEQLEFQCRNCSKKLPESEDWDNAYVVCPGCDTQNLVGRLKKDHRWIEIDYCNHYVQYPTSDLNCRSNVTCNVCGKYGKPILAPNMAAPLWDDEESETDD